MTSLNETKEYDDENERSNIFTSLDCIKSESIYYEDVICDKENENYFNGNVDIEEIDIKKELRVRSAVDILFLENVDSERKVVDDRKRIQVFSTSELLSPVNIVGDEKNRGSRSYKSEGKLSCDHCEFQTDVRQRMVKHMATHFRVAFLQCAECPFTSWKRNRLLYHTLVRHSDEYPFGCNLCSYKCKFPWTLKRHKAAIHEAVKRDKIKEYVCPECGKKIRGANNVKPHLKTHKKEDSYFCKKCSFSCRCPKSLKRHEVAHGGRRAPLAHACVSCSYVTAYPRHLRRHRATHLRSSSRRQQCPLCQHYFTSKMFLYHQTLDCANTKK